MMEAQAINPDLSITNERRNANYKRSEDLEHYIEGLQKAGLPD